MPSTYRRQQEPEEEDRRPRRRQTKSGPPILPILGLLVFIVAAIVLARIAAQHQKPEEQPVEQVDPDQMAKDIFGDLPEEEPPSRHGGGSGRARSTNRAPTGLANNATWIEALKIADQAAVRFSEATKAKASGDHSAWNTKANEAKDLYDRAITLTAAWEDELLEQYGDTDRQVREIMSVRSKWIEKLIVLHKTSGRD